MNPSVPSFSDSSYSDPLAPAPPSFEDFNPAKAEKKIIKFIRKSVKKSGTSGIVLGLSGGLDSAVVAALSVKAAGARNVYPIFFYDEGLESNTESTKNTNNINNTNNTKSTKNADNTEFASTDLEDALALTDRLDLPLQRINLSLLFSAAKSSFAVRSAPLSDFKVNSLFWEFGETPKTSGNLKARLHMSLLYYYANKKNLLVIGTKNKTEHLTGYFTKYGDGGVDIDPIAHLYKTEVRLLARHLSLPDSIIRKTPSAGFWDGQSDEEDMGIRFDQLDPLLRFFETRGTTVKSKGLKNLLQDLEITDKQYESVLRLMAAAKHKQKPPSMPKV
ncbi:MAG: NAD(+) synthase [Methanimicrococcus sp.]|nr:NAD(+) synthase [Methanimicrococcus sp.]